MIDKAWRCTWFSPWDFYWVLLYYKKPGWKDKLKSPKITWSLGESLIEEGTCNQNRTVLPIKKFETRDELSLSKAATVLQPNSVTDWTEAMTQLLNKRTCFLCRGNIRFSLYILFQYDWHTIKNFKITQRSMKI